MSNVQHKHVHCRTRALSVVLTKRKYDWITSCQNLGNPDLRFHPQLPKLVFNLTLSFFPWNLFFWPWPWYWLTAPSVLFQSRAQLLLCQSHPCVCLCVSEEMWATHTYRSLIIPGSLLGHFHACHPCSLPGLSKEVSPERDDTHIHTKVKVGGDKVTPHLTDTRLLSELGDNSSPLNRHTHTDKCIFIYM